MIIKSIGMVSVTDDGDLIIPLIVSKYESTKAKALLSEMRMLLDKGKQIICELKENKKKRTLDANAYFWVLCGKIADELRKSKEMISADDIYKKYIRDIDGNYEIVPIKDKAVETFCKAWSKNGIGWIYDNLGESKLKGFTNIKVYYGSSTYTADLMCRLVDEAIEECKGLGIDYVPTYKVKGYEFERG